MVLVPLRQSLLYRIDRGKGDYMITGLRRRFLRFVKRKDLDNKGWKEWIDWVEKNREEPKSSTPNNSATALQKEKV